MNLSRLRSNQTKAKSAPEGLITVPEGLITMMVKWFDDVDGSIDDFLASPVAMVAWRRSIKQWWLSGVDGGGGGSGGGSTVEVVSN
ncbi:hypothetical protein Tco_1049047 [Tanacetum coccineum]